VPLYPSKEEVNLRGIDLFKDRNRSEFRLAIDDRQLDALERLITGNNVSLRASRTEISLSGAPKDTEEDACFSLGKKYRMTIRSVAFDVLTWYTSRSARTRKLSMEISLTQNSQRRTIHE
jgi:hypothetical protein